MSDNQVTVNGYLPFRFNAETGEWRLEMDGVLARFVFLDIDGEERLDEVMANHARDINANTAAIETLDETIKNVSPDVISAVPAQNGTLTYNGAVQSPGWNGYNTGQLTISGTTSGTNAGTYTAVFTPKSGYKWPDGTTAAKSVNWTIGKAAGVLSVYPQTLELKPATPVGTISVTRAGNGAISAVSSNTNVATVSASGTTVTVNRGSQPIGEATITVSAAAGTNHNATSDKAYISVTAPSLPSKKALNDMTWAEIRAVSEAGLARDYFSVGDRKAVVLNGTIGNSELGTITFNNETYYCFIIGIYHNESIEGRAIHFQFGKTALTGGVDICFASLRMNATATTDGGWAACGMKNVICPQFVNVLPGDLRAVLKPVTKYTDNGSGESFTASHVTDTREIITLYTRYEALINAQLYHNPAENNYQQKYEYYESGNSVIRYKHNAQSTIHVDWTRSRGGNYPTSRFNVNHNPNGEANVPSANKLYGFAPIFFV